MRVLTFLLIVGGLAVAVSCAAQTSDVHRAAWSGDCARLEELIGRSPELVNSRDEGGDTPLHSAATMGKMDAVLLLLARGAQADARNSLDQSPILYAAYNGYATIVDTLIAHGAPFDRRDARGYAPIHFAARQGQTSVVELLVAKGAPFDERGYQGRTPLHFAAANGHTEIVKLLASRGAKLDTRDEKGRTPLADALGGGYVETAGLLLDAGCAIEGDAATLGSCANRAAAAGSERIVDALLAKGASLDARDESGRTLLHNAAIGDLPELARRLLARAGNLDAVDKRSKTALHYAVAAGNGDIVDLLLARGADPNIRDASGRTALHVAEDAGRSEMARALRAKGARDPERKVYRLGAESSVAAAKGGDAPLEITYIGNEGFLLSRGDKRAIVDALVRNPWTHPSIDDRVFGMMLENRPPFDGIDLCIVSHAHLDHMSPRMNAELLKRNDGVVFISSPAACDSLRSAAGSDFGSIAGRVVRVDPEWKTIEKMRKNGFDVAFFGVNHAPAGEEPFKTLATIFDFDGIRAVHLADEIVASNVENFKAVDLARDGIDIAFADVMFLSDSVGQYVMKEYIKPEYIILMHSGADELDAAENDLTPIHPNLVIFRESMEKKLFAH
jgi:ankyrin repeat protein/L-ascorbate metabolism protein UlaG (beta-lactamase superfamily)